MVNLWGKPRESWCLIVHWIDSGKKGYHVAAWKAWVDCKNLLPPPKAGERSPTQNPPRQRRLRLGLPSVPPAPGPAPTTTCVPHPTLEGYQVCGQSLEEWDRRLRGDPAERRP